MLSVAISKRHGQMLNIVHQCTWECVRKKANLERSSHEVDKLHGQMCLDKIKAVWWSLGAQQAVFTRSHSNRDFVMQTSLLSDLIAKVLKSLSEGEFMTEFLAATVELQAPDKAKLLQTVSLS